MLNICCDLVQPARRLKQNRARSGGSVMMDVASPGLSHTAMRNWRVASPGLFAYNGCYQPPDHAGV